MHRACNTSLQQHHCKRLALWCPSPLTLFPASNKPQVSSGRSRQSPCSQKTDLGAEERSTVVAKETLSSVPGVGSGGAAVTDRGCAGAGESYCPACPVGWCREVGAAGAGAGLEPLTLESTMRKMRPPRAAAVENTARRPGPERSDGGSSRPPLSWSWWWPCWTAGMVSGGWAELWLGSWEWFRPDCAARSGSAAGWAVWVAGRCSNTQPPEIRQPRTPQRWSPP